jgi:hypothetical protein
VDLIAIVILLGMVQGVFLGTLYIVIRGPNSRANHILGVLFICFSISIAHFFLLRTGLYSSFPHFIRVTFPILFLFGPLYYFYVRVLINRQIQLRWQDLLHAIPFILTVILYLPLYLSSAQEKLALLQQMPASNRLHMGMMGMAQVLQLSAYMFFVARELRAYDARIRNTRSSIERINLRWLRIGTWFFIWVFSLIFVLMALQALGVPTVETYQVVIPVIVTVVIYAMGYLGLRQPELYAPAAGFEPQRKYERSTMTPEEGRMYLQKLQAKMAQDKPYLETELTLPRLSECLSMPQHDLSRVINESLNQNFFDFVNGY